ncbi:PLAT domain-containing protein 3-like [Miscanthus floridulus]|uniref:PLAT domain-containing protein 3-like n=1 Tax=Miscanthus floridulus TaxID=154761 RepID=UPI0034598298
MKLKLLSPCLLLAFFAAAAYAAPASRAVAAAVTTAGAGALQSASSDPKNQCVYTVYVRTGSIWKGGTDSTIGVTLLGADGTGIRIRDLAAWGGLMGAGHDYYERGNLDIFSGRGPCMSQAPCAMNLTSDGSGAHHGWYCNYLEVTVTGPHLGCAQTLFTVEQWLATDASPYRLYAVVDECKTKRRRQETHRSPAGEPEPTVTAL